MGISKTPMTHHKKGESKGLHLFGTLEVDEFLLKPAFQKWVLNIILAIILALLFQYPTGEAESYKVYKVGDIAPEDIYADHDMLLPDPEATQAMLREAQQSVLPVFDYDPRAAKLIESRVRKVFADMRGLYQPEWDWNEAEKNRMEIMRKELRQRGGKRQAYVPEDNFAEKEAAVRASFTNILKDIGPTPVTLTDAQYSILKQDRFSEDVENKLVNLMLQTMNEGIVQDKANLPTRAGEGITVRLMPFQEASRDEFRKKDISGLNTLLEARKVISDRAQEQLGRDVSRSLRQTVVEIVQQLVVPNYSFDKAATDAAGEASQKNVEKVFLKIKKGEKIIVRGEVIDEGVEKKLRLMSKPPDSTSAVLSILGNFIWIAGFLAMLYAFPAHTVRKFKPAIKDLVHLALVTVILLAIFRVMDVAAGDVKASGRFDIAYLVPMVTGAMMVRLLINSETAVIFTIGLAVLTGMMSKNPVMSMFVMVGSFVGAGEVGQARTRTSIAKAGFITGMANVVLVLALALKDGHFLEPSNVYNAGFALANGILASFLVLAFMPLLEYLFGYVTDIRLLELANQEHPLLKALITNAPGTYQHSIMVGTLAEAAAEAIHVNPLLARVAALYHDVGKMEKPYYFVENQRDGVNRHDKLTPSMSSLIVKSHVNYGMELARAYRLPPSIINAIPQHHGTSLIKYFYARAKEREDPELQHVEEKDYRYPGPRPQTREGGILMLADAVEATARSLPDPTPARLKGMVRRIISGIFNDGQLDECEITLKDLNAISEAFTEVLTSIYHSRPEYPKVPGSGQNRSGSGEGGKKNGNSNSPGEQKTQFRSEGNQADTRPPKKNSIRSPV